MTIGACAFQVQQGGEGVIDVFVFVVAHGDVWMVIMEGLFVIAMMHQYGMKGPPMCIDGT